MNSNKSGGLKQAGSVRTFKLSPATRAIRLALAGSATLLALAGSGVAYAGTCATTAPNTVACNGTFLETVPGVVFPPATDLTLVLGDSAPTSVTPGTGAIGVDATWGGNVGVINHADITTTGADGIHQYGSTSATLDTDGSITTSVTAIGANAVDISASGDVSVVNGSDILAYAVGVYDVTALNSYSVNGNVSVDNLAAGTITATAQDGNAIALDAYAYGSTIVTNEGTITASSINGLAAAVIAQAYGGNASIANSGSISATSTNYQAVGVLASSSYGYATVDNAGSISAIGGQDLTIGIQASSESGSTINNTGTVYASGVSTTTGILAQAVDGNATIDNRSSITVNSGYDAIGVSAISVNGDASASSSGFMQVIGHGGLTSVIQAYSANGNASASNAGFVISGSYGGSAVGVSATSASGDAAATNTADGYLRVVTPGDKNARATGVSAITFNGDASASNDGTVTSISSYGSAVGINANATGGDAAASNTGTINASNVLFGNARGIQAVSSTGNAMVDNSGTIIAVSNQVLGYPFSLTTIDGIGAQSYTGTSITNIGYINAVGPWFVNGIEGFAIYGDVNVTNAESGKIVAIGLSADGIKVVADYGPFQAVVDNAGSIIVTQEGDCHCSGIAPYATGIYALSAFAGGVGVSNSGSISLNTQHGALGIRAYTYNNEATVDNSGSISIATTGYNQVNFGISDKSAYGDASVLNSGDITITTGAIPNVYHPINFVVGIYGHTGRHHTTNGAGYYGAGDTTIVNTGTINLIDAVTGIGIRAVAQYGSALVGNSGVISIDDIASGWGIEAEDDGLPCSTTCTTPSTGASVAVIDNSGSIVVTAPGDARGIVARTNGMSGAAITNSGDIELAAMGYSAFGVFVRNYAFTGTSDLTVDNSGSINASNHAGTNYAGFRGAQANGIRMLSYSNHSIVNNTGSITADTTTSGTAAGSALGVLVKNGYADHYGDTDISNAGSITASIISTNSTTSFHSYYARGAFAGGIVANATYGDVAVHNVGAIAATAKGAYYAGDGVTTADGISVVSSVGNSTVRSLTLGDLTVSNSSAGSITVSAESSYGTGSAVANGIAALVAVGSYGSSLVSSGYGIAVANAGSVSATAFIDAAAQGAATANGISAINGSAAGFSKVANSGDVTATATTTGAATATGVLANASIVDVALYSGGTVSANATGTSGNATGLSITGGTITAVNHGALDATFNGAGGLAYGANITSTGALSFTNTGAILATNVDDAIGVALTSATTTLLTNAGSITGTSSAGSSIAVQTGASADTINNAGSISGQIFTNDGTDAFNNSAGGLWTAVGSSDFGSGNDTITNAGTIVLNSESISLGDSDVFGNAFDNAGTVAVLGDSVINMGAGNTTAFTNTGIIDFRDGAPDDILTINGDFAGSGAIGVDVSGLNLTGDLLYVNGNVVDGSVTRVNTTIIDQPTSTTGTIAVVKVSGDSTAGNFVLGDVTFDSNQSFLTVRTVGIESAIDTSNATPDVFSVDFAVTGLSDAGTLAASFAPGVQSLMNSQIGTWRQRMGVIDQGKHGFGVWGRTFSDSGTIDPGNVAANIGQDGNFTFDQKNTGGEAGVNFGITDQFTVGLLAGKARATQTLNGGGTGSTKLDGDTSGAYATWISPSGFYVDASYRHMKFDAKLDSVAGESRTSGKANAFNVEAGYAFELGDGYKIEPQAQYTYTKVGHGSTLEGALTGFTPDGGTSSRARIGVQARKSFNTNGTTWTPYVAVSEVHEFDGKNTYAIDNTFFGSTNTKGTSTLLEGGLNVQVGNFAVFGGVNWQDGGALKSFTGGQVGIRYNW